MALRYFLPVSFLFLQMYAFGQTAPDFTVTDAHGQVHKLYEDYLNQGKTVVLKLFFTTCPPCNAIAPYFQELYEEWGEGQEDVQFIELSTLSTDTDQKVRDYEASHDLTIPGVSPGGGSLTANLPYRNGTFGPYFGTPTFVVIAPGGQVNYNVRGNGNDGTIQAIDQAIAATGAVKPGQVLAKTIAGKVTTYKNRPIPGVRVSIEGQPDAFAVTDTAGNFSFNTTLTKGFNYRLIAEKDGDFNTGVATFDLVFIRKHILRVDTFDIPHKKYIADASADGRITTFDVVLLSKLVLYVERSLSNYASPWIFMRQDLQADPALNFGVPFTSESNLSDMRMIGGKIGDVNDTVNLH